MNTILKVPGSLHAEKSAPRKPARLMREHDSAWRWPLVGLREVTKVRVVIVNFNVRQVQCP
jgi:hypothetical protein